MTARPVILAAIVFMPLAACDTTSAAPPPPTERQLTRLANFIGDRTPGETSRCIPSYTGMQIEAIGDKIVARWGGRRWVNQVQGSCRIADSANNFLATEADPANQYCENSTWRVVSNSGGMTVGSCMLGPWTEYKG